MAVPRLRTRSRLVLSRGAILGYSSTYQVLNGARVRLLQTLPLTYGAGFADMIERCSDELHAHWKSKRSLRAKGGPLDLRKTVVTGALSNQMTIDSGSKVYGYVGRFIAGDLGLSDTLSLGYSTAHDDLAAYAPTAWNRFRPGRPEVNMGVFLGELRDLPGMLRETCKRLKDLYRGLKSLGSHPMRLPYELVLKKGGRQAAQDYLSYQFGWAPFVGDLIRCYQTSKRIDRNLREIRANNGKLRRRGGVLVNTSDSVVERNNVALSSALYPALPTPMYSFTPRVYRTRTDSVRIWFKGAFRYYIPDVGTLQWKRRTERLLYGLTLNAEVVWSLIPWSWLVDWFSNVGDHMASLDTGWADNLTAKYAYVMGHKTRVYDQSVTVGFTDGKSLSLNTRFEYSSKQRVHATPYGFGVDFDSLNPRRLAILAALGITRLKAKSLFS